MKYKYAIVREPGISYDSCLSDHPLKRYINIGQARHQHKIYCQTLEELGLEIISLPREDQLPDACFVEDTVVIHKSRAFITRIGAESRRGEENEVLMLVLLLIPQLLMAEMSSISKIVLFVAYPKEPILMGLINYKHFWMFMLKPFLSLNSCI